MFKIKKIIMKKGLFVLVILASLAGTRSVAGEKGSVTVGTDLVSSFVWRGTKFGSGPAFQPYLEYRSGGFSAGAWGSYCFSENEAAEADLYLSYGFESGFSVGVTKYYFPGNLFFDSRSHGFEINSGFETGSFTISGNYMLNEGAGARGGDIYVEAGLKTGAVNWFVGAGNGWYTPDSRFNLCNVGLSASKEVHLTDSFSLPLFSSVILNPKTEQFHIVVGISL